MESVEIAWAAGLFEGEGSICIFEQKHNVLPLIRLCLQMTDRDIVERFCRIMECGRVTGEHRFGREHHKPTYRWHIGNRRDVERILLALLPYLGQRRTAKANEALAEIAKLDMICEHCGVKFRSHRISSKFCSSKCRSMAYYLAHRPAVRPSNVGRPRTL
jgi:hypothetical protein